MKFRISLPGGYVAGFSNAHGVQLCDGPHAKKFANRDAAQLFIDKYGDAGFGLNKKTARIEPIA
jgi:hypothetical protein